MFALFSLDCNFKEKKEQLSNKQFIVRHKWTAKNKIRRKMEKFLRPEKIKRFLDQKKLKDFWTRKNQKIFGPEKIKRFLDQKKTKDF